MLTTRAFSLLSACIALTLSFQQAPAWSQTVPPLVAFVGPFVGPRFGYTTLTESLKRLGYVEGQTIRYLQVPTGRGDDEIAAAVADAVRRRPDLIVAAGDNRTTLAAKKATSSIPIVFGSFDEPVIHQVVQSYARPGANVTGVANRVSEIMSKQLEIVKEVFPSASNVALLTGTRNSALEKHLEREAESRGMRLNVFIATAESDLSDVLRGVSSGNEALLVANDPHLMNSIRDIAAIALLKGTAVVCPFSHMARDGCLLTFGINLPHNYTRVAVIVDRILKGQRPETIPVEMPTSYSLTINKSVARRLNVLIPQIIEASADDILD